MPSYEYMHTNSVYHLFVLFASYNTAHIALAHIFFFFFADRQFLGPIREYFRHVMF